MLLVPFLVASGWLLSFPGDLLGVFGWLLFIGGGGGLLDNCLPINFILDDKNPPSCGEEPNTMAGSRSSIPLQW